jgi:adenylate cyclase class IV
MAKGNREIEVKFASLSSYKHIYNNLSYICEQLNPDFELIRGVSTDSYWLTPKISKAQFVRLRKNPNRPAQLTVKGEDNGNNVDRVEIDVDCDFKQANELMTFAYGEPLVVKKKYDVFFLEDEHTNVSMYQVHGRTVEIDGKEVKPIFIEIEAQSMSRLLEISQQFSKLTNINSMWWVKSSIYDMYVAEKKVKTSTLEAFFEQYK